MMKNAVLRMLLAVMILVAFGGDTLSIKNGVALASDKNEIDISDFLKNFVGKSPEGDYADSGGFKPHTALWDNPNIKKSLLKTLGVKRTDLLITGWGKDTNRYTVTPLGHFDDVVYFFSSKLGPKGSGNKNLLPMALVYIKMRDGSVQACYTDDSGDFWIDSEGKTRNLPKGYCNIDVTDTLAKKFYYENNPQTTSSSKSAVFAAPESVQRTKPEPSPCQGVNIYRGANIKNKAELERAITKQLIVKMPALKGKSITVPRVFTCENWSIVDVDPAHLAEPFSLFYDKNPLTSRYVAWWGGTYLDDGDDNESTIKDGVLKLATGIPPQLASCFARQKFIALGGHSVIK